MQYFISVWILCLQLHILQQMQFTGKIISYLAFLEVIVHGELQFAEFDV